MTGHCWGCVTLRSTWSFRRPTGLHQTVRATAGLLAGHRGGLQGPWWLPWWSCRQPAQGVRSAGQRTRLLFAASEPPRGAIRAAHGHDTGRSGNCQRLRAGLESQGFCARKKGYYRALQSPISGSTHSEWAVCQRVPDGQLQLMHAALHSEVYPDPAAEAGARCAWGACCVVANSG